MKAAGWLVVIGIGALALMSGGQAVMSYVGRLSITQLWTLAKNAGFSGSDLIIAVAVAMAESGGDPKALGDVNVPTSGSASYGLWQINSYFHPEFGPDFNSLYDPATNAQAAFSVYRAAGYSFTPWSTFKNGSYVSFLGEIRSILEA